MVAFMVSQRFLSVTGLGPNPVAASQIVRAQMVSSRYLIQSCDNGRSIIYIVDHLNLEPSDVAIESFSFKHARSSG
ncbi:homeobox-leucine zipper protein REVOLUTA [Solanum pennellii]|uniref:Homeobox-leucine zipper protein REVOLUTA n=1 Tax=Solanum pennellii TaxID=28526 RepID=A0ABM1V0H6_SOLPN|nr:homeobox-leucine zipper protein REVOLUTA [Solanum pennellii]